LWQHRAVLNPLVVPTLVALSLLAACGSEDTEPTRPTPDAGAETRDAALPSRDAGDANITPDAEPAPEASCLPFTLPSGVDCSAPDDGVLPKDLRCAGLYGDFDNKRPACGLLEYKPAYQLWSDDAEKRRWAAIPAGRQVDSADPDAFVYPVGTRFWKEFRVKTADGGERMAETRLSEKTAEGWLYTSYVWSEDEREATQMVNDVGVLDLYGTGHVVPTRDQCGECHNGRDDFVLGWDGVLLGAGAEGVTGAQLSAMGVLTTPLSQRIPGNAVEQAALGYLHANCGISCHNEKAEAKGRDSGLFLRLEQGELDSVMSTDAFTSGMNKKPSDNAKLEGLPTISGSWVGIRPGDPTRSLLVARQKLRGFDGQMPRIATNEVDQAGVQVVSDWVASMTRAAGYPAPVP
jgi:hypothetical protein